MTSMTTTLGALLSHTTGILLDTVDNVFELQDFVIGASLYTHERTGSSNNIRMQILSEYPKLMGMEPPKITTEEDARLWVQLVSEETGLPLEIEWFK